MVFFICRLLFRIFSQLITIAKAGEKSKKKSRRKRKRLPLPREPLLLVCNYSEMAPTGQAPAQAPQLTQVFSSISNLPPASLIALMGQALAQEPQAMQASEIL